MGDWDADARSANPFSRQSLPETAVTAAAQSLSRSQTAPASLLLAHAPDAAHHNGAVVASVQVLPF